MANATAIFSESLSYSLMKKKKSTRAADISRGGGPCT